MGSWKAGWQSRTRAGQAMMIDQMARELSDPERALNKQRNGFGGILKKKFPPRTPEKHPVLGRFVRAGVQ